MALSPPNSRVRDSPTLLFLFFSTLLSTSATKISYSDHCSSFVRSSPSTDVIRTPSSVTRLFQITGGHYSGGDQILGADPNSTLSVPRSLSFRPRSVRETLSPGTLSLKGILAFHGGGIRVSGAPGRSLRLAQIHPRRPRTYNRVGRVSFDLSGFWSEPDGRLCMVGGGFGRSSEGRSLDLSAVFKLNYPNVSNIWSAVVSGTIESLDDRASVNYFDPVRILVYNEMNYEFTKIPDAVRACSVVKAPDESLGFENGSFCGYRGYRMQTYRLEYKADCSGGSCGPFARRLGFTPSFMYLDWVHCSEDGGVRMGIAFSMTRFQVNRIFEPEKTLVGEGAWDGEKKRLCVVACRVADANESSTVSDCTIGLSLWFPSVLSIQHRSTVSGQIWSDRDENDSGYFDMVTFETLDKSSFLSYDGLKYKYTKLDLVNSSCVQGYASSVRRRRFPDVKKADDMSFSIFIKDAGGNSSWGYADLLFVGETLYGSSLQERFSGTPIPIPALVDDDPRCLNVSYDLWYGNGPNPTEISAEGTYDVETGTLIMVGCRQVGSSLDCEILINIQLAPLNPKEGEYSKGKISSGRENSDPLFFKPLEISVRGMYRTQAAENIRWMNIEIAMVLLSLTLSCIFIGLQLYHIKKHPEVIPSISITMLVILTLGHMIPVVLNFEALFFKNHNRQISLVQSSEWLEVNEVVVRVITMVAFLLQSRLLQVAWSARSADGRKQGLWNAERKSLVLCFPIYMVGGLITLFIHFRSFGTQQKRLHYSSSDYHSLWEDLFSYAGLVFDAFLFPQFLLNIFCNSKDKSLAPAFYGGTTVVRALPHVYDAYRAHHYIPHPHFSYIYASQNGDIYSSAWDIIIPCAGMLFGVLIFLQQRFGGALILPKKIRESGGYEMVPVVGH